MTIPPDEAQRISELTERQQAVLRLHREGKGPTEIGRELDISSQAVHGHYRRLRAHGLIEETSPRVPATRQRPGSARPARNGAEPFDPASTIRVVVQTITAQIGELNSREQEIDDEVERLKGEKKAIAKARAELEKLIPEPAT